LSEVLLHPEVAAVIVGQRRWGLIHGDSAEVLRSFQECCVDACVTDAPYGLGKQPDPEKLLRAWLNGEDYRTGRGFMGSTWDQLPGPRIWREVWRVLKPGAYCFVFAGSRTVDLMGLALRLAGFEIRDVFGWVYGQGQPHGENIDKGIDDALGVEREVVGRRMLQGTAALSCKERGGTHSVNVSGAGRSKEVVVTRATSELAKKYEGWNTGIKPAIEPLILARKPLEGTVVANTMAHGTGGLNIDACRVPTDWSDRPDSWKRSGVSAKPDAKKIAGSAPGIGINCHPAGRYPANLLLCHLPECGDTCAAGCPVLEMDRQSGDRPVAGGHSDAISDGNRTVYGAGWSQGAIYDDAGTASRYFNQFRWTEEEVAFFYAAKADRGERERGLDGEKSSHTTHKPIEEERWRCRLVTPPGGLILDPFAGVCSCGVAAMLEGFRWLGIELMDTDRYPFVRQGRTRMEHVVDERPPEQQRPGFGRSKQGSLFG
jgi:site-specific DNA-methyltransferase (adenine-specific)